MILLLAGEIDFLLAVARRDFLLLPEDPALSFVEEEFPFEAEREEPFLEGLEEKNVDMGDILEVLDEELLLGVTVEVEVEVGLGAVVEVVLGAWADVGVIFDVGFSANDFSRTLSS